MEVREFEINGVMYKSRRPEEGDFAEMIELHKSCFPATLEEDGAWREDQLASHLKMFEEG